MKFSVALERPRFNSTAGSPRRASRAHQNKLGLKMASLMKWARRTFVWRALDRGERYKWVKNVRFIAIAAAPYR